MELSGLKIGIAVYCETCRKQKCPRGRSASAYRPMCDFECYGYNQSPLVGDLWPGEMEHTRLHSQMRKQSKTGYQSFVDFPRMQEHSLLMLAWQAKENEMTTSQQLAMGRIFRMMSRPFQEGDIQDYERCRMILMEGADTYFSEVSKPWPGWNFGHGNSGCIE